MKKPRLEQESKGEASADFVEALKEAILSNNLEEVIRLTQSDFFEAPSSGVFLRFVAANPANKRDSEDIHRQIIHALIDAGSPVNSSDRSGMTPLMWAAAYNNAAAAQILIDRCAEVKGGDNRGRTALMKCFLLEVPDKNLINILLTHTDGVDILVLPKLNDFEGSVFESKKSAFYRAAELAFSNRSYVDIFNEMTASAARAIRKSLPMEAAYQNDFEETLSVPKVRALLTEETLRIIPDFIGIKTDSRDLTEAKAEAPSSNPERPSSPTAESKKRSAPTTIDFP